MPGLSKASVTARSGQLVQFHLIGKSLNSSEIFSGAGRVSQTTTEQSRASKCRAADCPVTPKPRIA